MYVHYVHFYTSGYGLLCMQIMQIRVCIYWLVIQYVFCAIYVKTKELIIIMYIQEHVELNYVCMYLPKCVCAVISLYHNINNCTIGSNFLFVLFQVRTTQNLLNFM